jgi:mannosyltransferase OCH1-like enzyme
MRLIVFFLLLILGIIGVIILFTGETQMDHEPEPTILDEDRMNRIDKHHKLPDNYSFLIGHAEVITGVNRTETIIIRKGKHNINRENIKISNPAIPLIKDKVAYFSDEAMDYLLTQQVRDTEKVSKKNTHNPLDKLLSDGWCPIPSVIHAKETSDDCKIPKIIHQTFAYNILPKAYGQAVFSWINRNPDYEYRYYNDDDMRNYIVERHPEALTAYDKLIPHAFKCDLWRLCVLYCDGGVYTDIKSGCIKPLTEIIPSDVELVLVSDRPNCCIYNAFMASTPKHPIIKRMIDTVCDRVLREDYGVSFLDITGPLAIGNVVVDHFDFVTYKRIPEGLYGTVKIMSIDNSFLFIRYKREKMVRPRHSRELYHLDAHKSVTGRPHYTTMWFDRNVFH